MLTDDEKDILQELVNVAYGHATASIAQILDAFATLHIPEIDIVDIGVLQAHLKDSVCSKSGGYYMGVQLFNGKFFGENIFLLDEESALNLSRRLFKQDEDSEQNIIESISELTNILSSSITGRLAQSFNTTVSFSFPNVQKINPDTLLDNANIVKYDKIIIFSTLLEFKDQHISGKLMLMTQESSFSYIKEEIRKILESLT